jgi:hypothetical protein
MFDPGTLALMIPILGILLGMLAVFLDHQQKMAKLRRGEGGGERNARTLELLTDTLEREHEKLVQLQQRVERLEAQAGVRSLPDAPDVRRIEG